MLLFFFDKNFLSLSLKENVSNKFKPGNLIKSMPSARSGYGGPEITSTLWPILVNAMEISFI